MFFEGAKVEIACLKINCCLPSVSIKIVKLSNDLSTPRNWKPFVKKTVKGTFSFRNLFRYVSCTFVELAITNSSSISATNTYSINNQSFLLLFEKYFQMYPYSNLGQYCTNRHQGFYCDNTSTVV